MTSAMSRDVIYIRATVTVLELLIVDLVLIYTYHSHSHIQSCNIGGSHGRL